MKGSRLPFGVSWSDEALTKCTERRMQPESVVLRNLTTQSACNVLWINLQLLYVFTRATMPMCCYRTRCINSSHVQYVDNVSQAFENLLRLLGWSLDQEGPMATTFGRTADVLGITIELSKSEQYIMSLRNTDSRKAEI